MNVYIAIILMAVVTYLIRVLPLVVFRKPIKNRFFRSFLYYAPYVTLSVLTFPAILYVTGSTGTAVVGFAVALVCAFCNLGLPATAAAACAAVYIAQLIF